MKLVAIVIALAAATAHADPMSTKARVHFDRGLKLYNAGAYADAIAELTAGRELDGHPDFLYALGQAYRKLGDCAHAVEHLRAFLATQPPDSEAVAARANIARCPLPAPSEPAQERPIARPRVAAPPRRPFYADTAGDMLAVGGIAGVGVGVTYLVLGERDARAANTAPTIARLEQLSANAGRERTIGALCTVAGGGFTAGAIVRYVLASRRDPGLAIAVAPGSISIAWSGSW
jgi:tetratricopeptide (TPR) repeat protein